MLSTKVSLLRSGFGAAFRACLSRGPGFQIAATEPPSRAASNRRKHAGEGEPPERRLSEQAVYDLIGREEIRFAIVQDDRRY